MSNSTTPNILLLIGEDTGLHPGCYGNDYASTPHIDRLAEQGARYTHALTTCPVCAPSRSSVVTGIYPWSLGTHAMRSTLLQPPRLFTHHLRDLGYYVNWHTKTDFNFDPTYPPGDDPFCDEANDWIDRLAQGSLPDRPLFLYRNFGVTHESTMWDRAWGHDWGMRRERLDHQHLLLPHQRHDPAKAPVPPYLPDTPNVRQNIAWYFDALSIQDHQVGKVLEALDRSGKAQDTVVIYMTDHGRGLPREKRWCYEAGLHLPLIVRWPARIRPGTVIDEIVNWVDIAPTILRMAGLPGGRMPERFQGRAFLGDDLTPPRRYAFAGRDRMDETYDSQRVARDHRFHYIRNDCPNLPYAQRNLYMERMLAMHDLRVMRAQGALHGDAAVFMRETKPAEELYDWRADPHMVRNLADDPAFAADRARLRAALEQHLQSVGDLGAVPERELVARGLVKDRLEEYRSRVAPLPTEHRIGPELTCFEMHEARAYVPRP